MPDVKPFHKLSERQQAILIFIEDHIRRMGYPPTIREIGAATEISSTCVTSYNLDQLIAWGYLAKTSWQPRTLRVLIKPPKQRQRKKSMSHR